MSWSRLPGPSGGAARTDRAASIAPSTSIAAASSWDSPNSTRERSAASPSARIGSGPGSRGYGIGPCYGTRAGTAAGLRGAGDGLEQPAGDLGNLVDGAVERLLVPLRRSPGAAGLAHVLKRRLPDLGLVCRHITLAEPFDASAHALMVPAMARTTPNR